MGRPVVCDQRDCPAPALHHVEVYGQDFHFCGHHWAELSPALLVQVSRPDAEDMRRHGRGRTGGLAATAGRGRGG